MRLATVNAGCKLASVLDVEVFLESVGGLRWDVLFVSEFCAWSEYVCLDTCTVQDFTVFKHYPGSGSHCLAFIVRNCVLPSVAAVSFLGRAGVIRLRLLNSRLPLSVIGLHGSHGDEILQSLSEVAEFLRSATNYGPKCVLGDFNIDLLPSLHVDPFQDVSNRNMFHRSRRHHLNEFFQVFNLDDVIPYDVCSVPCNDPSLEYLWFAPVTRLPIGEQHGLPSLLDYMAVSGCDAHGAISWEHAIADHAFVWFDINVKVEAVVARHRTHWKCLDKAEFLEQAQQLFVDESTCYDTFVLKLQELQTRFDTNLCCAERRRRRMPLQLRTLMCRLAKAVSLCDAARLRKLVWERKKQWIKELHLISRVSAVRKGRVIAKSKKLFSVKGIQTADGNIERSPNSCSEHIASAFRKKWASGREEDRLALLDIMFGAEKISCGFEVEEIAEAFKRVRNKDKLDCDSIALSAVELLFISNPLGVSQFLNALVADTPSMTKLTCMGVPTGKDSAVPVCSKVRLLLPQGSILSVLDVLLSSRLHQFINKELTSNIQRSIYVGARPGTQTMEIAFGLQLAIEKGLDLNSQCCIGQLDLLTYYDALPLRKIAVWLIGRGFPKPWVAAILRHQAAVAVKIAVKGSSERPSVGGRGLGGLTGSRTACALARIPVEVAALTCGTKWSKLGFQHTISMAFWVDNVFVVCDSPSHAVKMLEEFQNYMASAWNLQVKPSSRAIMPVQDCAEPADYSEWPVSDVFVALGHTLCADGSSKACRQFAISSAWRAFWSNLGSSSKRCLSTSLKLSLFQRAVEPILSYRWIRWPFVKGHALELDAIQRKMVRHLLARRCQPGEDVSHFFARARNEAASYCWSQGLWSVKWALGVLGWICHVIRDTNDACWSAPVLNVMPLSILSSRRSVNSGRPATRLQPGFICRRYLECTEAAFHYLEENAVDVSRVFDYSALNPRSPSSFENLFASL